MVSQFDTGFKTAFLERLGDVQHLALQEVEHLHRDLAKLRNENSQLRLQLGARSEPGGTELAHVGEAAEFGSPEQPACSSCDSSDVSSLRPAPCSSDASTAKSPDVERLSPAHRVQRKLSADGLLLSLPGDGMNRRPSKARSSSKESKGKTNSPSKVNLTWSKATIRSVVTSSAFENVTLAFVLLNAVWVGIDLDLNGKPLLESPPLYQVVEHIFVAIFFVEFLVRLMSFATLREAFHDKWVIIDMVLVPLMVIDSWILTLLVVITGNSDIKGLGILSILRLLRVMRIVRIGRICRVVPELETMILSMVAGVRSVLITATLLFAMTYGCAILLRQLSMSTAWGQELFPNVPASVYVLLVQSLLPDHGDLLTEIMKEKWYCGLIYFIFLLFSAIMVVNMLIALLCDVVGKQSREEQDQRAVDSLTQKLEVILQAVDENYDGVVSRAEFEKIIDKPDAVRVFQDAGVDLDTLIDEADFIFGQKGRSQLSFEDFKEEVLQFRQTSFATMGTITATRRFIRLSLEQVMAKIVRLETLVSQLGAANSQIVCTTDRSPVTCADLDRARYREVVSLFAGMWQGRSRQVQ